MTQPPLIVGEVLFDHFPDGRSVLGGAPFNVAWNLRGLGMSPLMITAVGDDLEGEQVTEKMQAWGLPIAGVQTSPLLPTGKVVVTLDGSEPEYDLLDQRAYDDIRYPDPAIDFGDYRMLYVGSLAYRHETSRATIRRLMHRSGLPKFVDINIREPWFSRESGEQLLEGAAAAKLNISELAWLADAACESPDQVPPVANKFRDKFGIDRCFVTCGGSGAVAVDSDGEASFAKSPPPDPMVDTVGAGDAFAAATIYGLCHDWPLDKTLRGAVRFASRACTLRGATSEDPAHYSALVTD